jgi:aspartate/methionine/tyrosine aminotransferase
VVAPESIVEADALVEQYAVYRDISDYSTDSLEFCAKLLADTGVAIAPGIDFDTVHGGAYVRMSFAGPTSDITEALRRMGEWFRQSRYQKGGGW